MKKLFILSLLLSLLISCASPTQKRVKRIEDQKFYFASLEPQSQAQIQNGRIDTGFNKEMVLLALGEPNDKSKEKNQEIWRYTRREITDYNKSSSPGFYGGYEIPVAGGARPGTPGASNQAPMSPQHLRTYKVYFEKEKVTRWDEGLF
jgi:hypothetical protein